MQETIHVATNSLNEIEPSKDLPYLGLIGTDGLIINILSIPITIEETSLGENVDNTPSSMDTKWVPQTQK